MPNSRLLNQLRARARPLSPPKETSERGCARLLSNYQLRKTDMNEHDFDGGETVRVLIEMKTVPDLIALLSRHDLSNTNSWALDTQWVRAPKSNRGAIFDFCIGAAYADGKLQLGPIEQMCQEAWDLDGHASFYLLDPEADPPFGIVGWRETNWQPVAA